MGTKLSSVGSIHGGSQLDPDTTMGGPHGQFPSTQLSLLEAASSGAALPNEALERVSALYWKPVYRFIRVKFRKNNEDAKDLTQSFFATALQRDFFARFDPAKASFRTYLRMAVERFAASQHAAENRQKRGGGVEFEPVEEQAVTSESPEDVFEREWQRQLFVLALADLAARHGAPETSVTNYLAWARRMLRQFVTERLRGVTAGERDLRDEMRRLWARKTPPPTNWAKWGGRPSPPGH